jgi:hypothetical protein
VGDRNRKKNEKRRVKMGPNPTASPGILIMRFLKILER